MLCCSSECGSISIVQLRTNYCNTHVYTFYVCLCLLALTFVCNYSACRRRGGVLKCPRFCFFFFFGVESWAAAHGLYRCTEYRLLSEPMSTRLLNSISSRICRQNTQFNMYTTTSKQQEGCTFKDSHPKCFITTNFDKFHREAFARGGESRWCFDSMFPWYTKSKTQRQFEWRL